MKKINHYGRRLALALGTIGLVVGSLAGCGGTDSDCQGDPGVVTDKDWDSNGKRADDYDITVLRADGSTYEKDVTSTGYDWYKRGSKFPSAKHCANGKAK